MTSKIIVGLLFLTVLIAGCTSNSGTPVIKPPENQKEFNINITSAGFSPNTITVNQGDTVIINLFDPDTMDHGFALATYNIEERIEPGQKKTVKFLATVAGDLNFYCYIGCGEDFASTRGRLTVIP